MNRVLQKYEVLLKLVLAFGLRACKLVYKFYSWCLQYFICQILYGATLKIKQSYLRNELQKYVKGNTTSCLTEYFWFRKRRILRSLYNFWRVFSYVPLELVGVSDWVRKVSTLILSIFSCVRYVRIVLDSSFIHQACLSSSQSLCLLNTSGTPGPAPSWLSVPYLSHIHISHPVSPHSILFSTLSEWFQ